MLRDMAANSCLPNGARPGTMNTTSSVIRPSTVSRLPAALASIQVATRSRIARSSSVMAGLCDCQLEIWPATRTLSQVRAVKPASPVARKGACGFPVAA